MSLDTLGIGCHRKWAARLHRSEMACTLVCVALGCQGKATLLAAAVAGLLVSGYLVWKLRAAKGGSRAQEDAPPVTPAIAEALKKVCVTGPVSPGWQGSVPAPHLGPCTVARDALEVPASSFPPPPAPYSARRSTWPLLGTVSAPCAEVVLARVLGAACWGHGSLAGGVCASGANVMVVVGVLKWLWFRARTCTCASQAFRNAQCDRWACRHVSNVGMFGVLVCRWRRWGWGGGGALVRPCLLGSFLKKTKRTRR
jgi:hypothetical protein